MKIAAEVTQSHRLVIIVRADVNVELVIRCTRQTKHIEQLAMSIKVTDGVDHNLLARRCQLVVRAGM